MKHFRKPYLAFFLASLILLTSCNVDELTNENETFENFKFDFSLFNENKGKLIEIESFMLDNKYYLSRLELNNYILEQVNDFHNTNINFDNDLKTLKTSEDILNWLENNSDFNQQDISILKNLKSDLISIGLDEAISALEYNILEENLLDDYKIDKYQSIVNGVKLIEYQYPGFFTSDNLENARSCSWALAKLALAAASLVVACNPASAAATVGVSCYLAAAGYIAASASVGMECGDQNQL